MTTKTHTGGLKEFVYSKEHQQRKLTQEEKNELRKVIKKSKKRKEREEIESKKFKNKFKDKFPVLTSKIKFKSWIRWNFKWLVIVLIILVVVGYVVLR
ncbi:MAG: hypothetical protein ABIH25_05305 [Candidatus Woesearchaeota archaeon]